ARADGHTRPSARHRRARPRHPEPAHLGRPRVAAGRHPAHRDRGPRGARAGTPRRLRRGAARPRDHARPRRVLRVPPRAARHRDRGRDRTRHAEPDVRARGGPGALQHAPRPPRPPFGEAARVRGGRARPRRGPRPADQPAPAAQRAAAPAGLHQHAGRHDDRGLGRPELPRPGRAAAHAGLGRHGGQRPPRAVPGRPRGHHPGHPHRRRGPGLQLRRRRSARGPRPSRAPVGPRSSLKEARHGRTKDRPHDADAARGEPPRLPAHRGRRGGGGRPGRAPPAGGAAGAAGARATAKRGRDQTPKKGGTLVYGMEGPSDILDPQATGCWLTYRVTFQMFEGLLAEDLARADVAIPPMVPKLAESYTTAKDGPPRTFKLRKGVKFHDGTPFNAAAAVFSWERMYKKDAPHFYPRANSYTSYVVDYITGA